MTDATTHAFREAYRASEIPVGYSGRAHVAFTFGGGLAALAACLWQLEQVQPLEWLTVPLAFLYANLAEYVGHRWPMHRPFRGLGLIYKRHAGQHHRFFTDRDMPYDDVRDLRAVLFPPILVVFFFGLFATPVWLLLAWFVSSNVAWLFVATGLAYYLNYEFLHFAYHARPDTWISRLPGLARLRALHQTHHDPRLMAHWNFNITYPIGDALFRTRWPGQPPDG